MAVFRIEKTRDFTVMSNYHLRDVELSLCIRDSLYHDHSRDGELTR